MTAGQIETPLLLRDDTHVLSGAALCGPFLMPRIRVLTLFRGMASLPHPPPLFPRRVLPITSCAVFSQNDLLAVLSLTFSPLILNKSVFFISVIGAHHSFCISFQLLSASEFKKS